MTVNTLPHAQKIIEAKALGMSRAEIAKMLNLSPHHVSFIAPIFAHDRKHSPEFIQQVVDEFLSGDSSSIIAERHNITRSKVAGILYRAKVFGKRAKTPIVKVKRVRGPTLKPRPQPVEVVPLHIPFLDRRPDQCALLYGDDPKSMTWCGHPTYGTTSWCEAHAKIVFAPREARNRAPRPR